MPPRPRLKPPSFTISRVPLQRQSRLFTHSTITSSLTGRIVPLNSPSAIDSPDDGFSFGSRKGSDLIPSGYWYKEIKERLGKCIMFGCSRGQAQKIASVLRDITAEWRILTAGSGGFLTDGNTGFVDQKVAFGEASSWGYISNANYLRFIESSRINWLMQFANLDPKNGDQWRDLLTAKGPSLIVQSFRASYKFPLKYPDTISTYHRLQSLPTEKDKIIFTNCVVISHKQRRVAAATRETSVLFNHMTSRKMPIPPFMLKVFQDVWHQQEEEEKRARARIFELAQSVRKFEKQTWDKEGAVEDMGT